MAYWMTQSLLSSWTYWLNADDERAHDAWESFNRTLRREKTEPTQAMQDGILFEGMVNDLTAGKPIQAENAKWEAAARQFAKKCAGGISQLPITGNFTVDGMDFVLYGVCDYVKAGIIYDIKKVTRYEYGKYQHSTQHPLYLHLIPEASRFDYLIFDGSRCYVETYRRQDCTPITQTIAEFIHFLKNSIGLEAYTHFWAMNEERELKRRWACDLYRGGST